MHPLKKLYCRTFQTVFKLAIPFLPYRSPELLHGMDELIDKLKALKLNHVLLVTDKGIRSLGLTSRLEQLMEQNNILCTVYDGTVANPTTDNVEEALHLYKENNCQALIGFGGGSSMDCAKAVGACIARPKTPLMKMKGILKVIRPLPPLLQCRPLQEQEAKPPSLLSSPMQRRASSTQSMIFRLSQGTPCLTRRLHAHFRHL